jgi:hypothetical protein
MPAAPPPRIPLDSAWFEAIPRRVSHRTFNDRPIASAVLERIGAVCDRLSNSASRRVRVELVPGVPDGVFKGLIGAYGGVSGATAFVAFLGSDDALLDIGYVGEAIVLEATAAGLDTCWVAGSFDSQRTSRLFDLAEGEAVRAVSPLGHGARRRGVIDFMAQKAVRSRTRLPLETIAPGVDRWPDWARQAAEAARLAPSGVNGQPWRLRLEDGMLVVASKTKSPYWTTPFDCGIAMLHAELGAMRSGLAGRWERLVEPDVARFVPDGSRLMA